MGDAAGANAKLATRSGGRIVHSSCNAHARRYFAKAQSNDPVLASQMVALYQQLYAIEYRGVQLSVDERWTTANRQQSLRAYHATIGAGSQELDVLGLSRGRTRTHEAVEYRE